MNRRNILQLGIFGFSSFVIPNIGKAATNWQTPLNQLNDVREDADDRELLIHGNFVIGPRPALDLSDILNESAQWWCEALKGSGIADHGWYTNKDGFLIASPQNPRILSRVWLPSIEIDPGVYWCDFVVINNYLGIEGSSQGQNLLRRSNVRTNNIVDLFTETGWNDDPLKATHHYSTMIVPFWTHCGFGMITDGGGRKIAVINFAKI